MSNIGTFLTATSGSVKSKKDGKGKKGNKITGIIFLIVGLLVLLVCSFMYLNWSSKKNNYIQIYAYSSNGLLEYKYNDQSINVDKISNYYDETILLKIPDGKSIKLFCEKNNNSNCIYFDESNELESSIVNNPILAIFCSLFLVVIGLFFIEKSQPYNPNKNKSYSMFCFFSWIALSGLFILGWQIVRYSNYNELKKQNNVITANVYSEIYNKNSSNESHKILATYNVNNSEYTYVRDFYKKGNIEKSIKLFYDSNNPSIAIEDEKSVNIGLIIISLMFVSASIPYLLLSGNKNNKKSKWSIEKLN